MSTRVLAACLGIGLLTGCQTTITPYSPVVTVAVEALPENIQKHVVNVCNWLEPVQSIARIVANLGGPSVPDIANQVAAEICTAVRPPRIASRRSSTYRVAAGVRLQGRFVAQ